jgi:hypothetical protein
MEFQSHIFGMASITPVSSLGWHKPRSEGTIEGVVVDDRRLVYTLSAQNARLLSCWREEIMGYGHICTLYHIVSLEDISKRLVNSTATQPLRS